MAEILPVVVTRSLLFVLFFSAALFGFIILRRMAVHRREVLFETRYLKIEEDVLNAIGAGDEPAAVDVALKHGRHRKVLTQVLIDFLELIKGRGRETLEFIFDAALREQCLKDLHSPFMARRLQATRLAGFLSAAPEKARLVKLLKDRPIIRLAAVNTLVQFPDPECLALVFRAFEEEDTPNVHTYINIIFGAGDRVEPFVRAALRRPLPVEKLCLLLELAAAVPLPTLFPEVTSFAAHPAKEVRIKVAKALSRFLIPDSYSVLEELAGDAAWEVQAQAFKGLGKIKDAGALVILTRGLYSPVWHVRYNAREALIDLGPIGITRLEEVARQKEDRFASDMAAMALEDLSLAQGEA
jgi:hypothetical protein